MDGLPGRTAFASLPGTVTPVRAELPVIDARSRWIARTRGTRTAWIPPRAMRSPGVDQIWIRRFRRIYLTQRTGSSRHTNEGLAPPCSLWHASFVSWQNSLSWIFVDW